MDSFAMDSHSSSTLATVTVVARCTTLVQWPMSFKTNTPSQTIVLRSGSVSPSEHESSKYATSARGMWFLQANSEGHCLSDTGRGSALEI